MEFIHTCIDFFLHIDHHIGDMISQYGVLSYLILFLIIFAETGLVIVPFLPGDSLLFVLGAFAAKGDLNALLMVGLLSLAAVVGDAVNYFIGSILQNKIRNNEKIPFIKKDHVDKTAAFFEKYGNKAIILARFVPLIRTFAPFLAGVGGMRYPKFALYNIIGGIAWTTIGISAGFLFGNLPWVQKNFSLVVLAIVVISIIPMLVEFLKSRPSR